MPRASAPISQSIPLVDLAAGARCVILLHELPDGSSHFDWMIETQIAPAGMRGPPQDPDGRTLACFRCSARVDELAVAQQVEMQRLPDHRRRYLEFQGEIGRGLGSVKRVAAGRILQIVCDETSALQMHIEWAAPRPDFAPTQVWFRLAIQQESRIWTLSRIERQALASSSSSPPAA